MGNKKELKKLSKQVRYLKKGQKKLRRQIRQFEKALAGADAAPRTNPAPLATTAPTTTQNQSSLSLPSQSGASYPEPMKSGKYSPTYVQYRVTEAEPLTPTVMRVVGKPAGKDRAGAQGLVGEYIRVITGKSGEVLGRPDQEGKKPSWSQPVTSTKYTVRRYTPSTGELEINIVLHERGAGTTWARTVAPGDYLHLTGAKSGYRVSEGYDFYLLAGDETGLPGMARWLETLPASARGALFVEVPGAASRQELAVPDGFELVWVDSGERGALARAVQGYEIPGGSVFVWLAGESGSIQPLRSWVRRELGVPKGHGYSKGYWKRK